MPAALWRLAEDGQEARAELDARRGARRKFALSSGNQNRINAMMNVALPYRTVKPDQLDAEPLAINLLNGTLRVVSDHDSDCPNESCQGECGRRTWAVRLDPHNRDDKISKLMPIEYDPAATCPSWLAFVERFQPKENVRAFVQRYHGLALTARTEQVFVLNYGTGGECQVDIHGSDGAAHGELRADTAG